MVDWGVVTAIWALLAWLAGVILSGAAWQARGRGFGGGLLLGILLTPPLAWLAAIALDDDDAAVDHRARVDEAARLALREEQRDETPVDTTVRLSQSVPGRVEPPVTRRGK